MKSFLSLALFSSSAFAHNFLSSPASFNGVKGKANTASPCERAKASDYVKSTVTPEGDVSISWSTNHGGAHYYKIVPEDEIDTLETTAEAVELPAKPENEATITAPATPGTYIVQYSWQNYRNCFELEVTAGGNEAVTADSDQPFDDTPDCPSFCTDYIAQCTDAKYAFSSLEVCQATCALYPRTGKSGEYTGNTLQCRWAHLHNEAPGEHCDHASYGGGGKCVGGDYNHGVSVLLTVDPNNFPAADMVKEKIEKTLTDMGYAGHNVETPVGEGTNMYNVIVTFTAPEGSQHSMTPAESVKLLQREEDTFGKTVTGDENILKLSVTTAKTEATGSGVASVLPSVCALLLPLALF